MRKKMFLAMKNVFNFKNFLFIRYGITSYAKQDSFMYFYKPIQCKIDIYMHFNVVSKEKTEIHQFNDRKFKIALLIYKLLTLRFNTNHI